MVEIIAFFIFHRAQLYANKTGQNYRSSSAIFDGGAWLLLIVLLNSVFLTIIVSVFSKSKFWHINTSSYSYTYRLILFLVVIGIIILWIIYRTHKNRFNELFSKFDNEEELVQKKRLEANRWIYRITWIGAIISLVCSSISRWNVAGSIF